MELQNYAAKNSLWRLSIVITPRFDGSDTNKNKGKSSITKPNFKRPKPTNFRQNMFLATQSFGVSGRK